MPNFKIVGNWAWDQEARKESLTTIEATSSQATSLLATSLEAYAKKRA